MIFRKTIHKLGFQNPECLNVFKLNYKLNRQKASKQFDQLFNEASVSNIATHALLFCDEEDNVRKPIDELPPLLDPALFKDLKNLEKAVEQHRAWCSREWTVKTRNTKLEINNSYPHIAFPEEKESIKELYRMLAKDFPVIMEFVPSAKVICKLIERAAQLDPDKIDLLLNPY
jgi:hypothetical protein